MFKRRQLYHTLFQDALSQHSDQGILVNVPLGRRCCLRLMALSALMTALCGPIVLLAKERGDIVDRYPWMLPWLQEGLERSWLQALLGGLTPHKRVIFLMDHQAEAKPYHEYRAQFINKRRIQKGRQLMRKYQAELAAVVKRYQVPAEFVVALWGIESDFGHSMGRFNVLRTLFTLSAYYPRRAEFFRNELRAFLLFCKEEGWNPRLITGSYAGAIGQVQMMPSTLRRFGVDFDQNGKRDVIRSVSDSLASIGAFLRGYDWSFSSQIVQPLAAQPGLSELFASAKKTRKTWQEWRSLGVLWPKNRTEPPLDSSLALIILEERHGERYHMTFMNFWVLTQWNRSNRFAMAVCELATELIKPE